MQGPSGGLGYSNPNSVNHARTAIGARCFQMWKGESHQVARKAIKYLDKELKFAWDSPVCDLYQQYFAAPAMRIHGGEPWKRYHAKVFLEIIKHQAADGSFLVPDPGDAEKINATRTYYLKDDDFGKHYRTCLATMILQAYSRYISIFFRNSSNFPSGNPFPHPEDVQAIPL